MWKAIPQVAAPDTRSKCFTSGQYPNNRTKENKPGVPEPQSSFGPGFSVLPPSECPTEFPIPENTFPKVTSSSANVVHVRRTS